MKYPIYYAPPRLQSFSINNFRAAYRAFDFEHVRGWLRPRVIADSLQYIRVGNCIEVDSFSKFIADLGNEPVVHTLHFFVEITEWIRESLIILTLAGIEYSYCLGADVGLDLSHLSNLKHLWLDGPDMTNDVGMTQCICQLFAQVNVANLEEATVHLTSNPGLECIKELDRFLAEERFDGLKQLNVSLVECMTDRPVEGAPETIRSLFVNMNEKGILKVIDPPAMYMP